MSNVELDISAREGSKRPRKSDVIKINVDFGGLEVTRFPQETRRINFPSAKLDKNLGISFEVHKHAVTKISCGEGGAR